MVRTQRWERRWWRHINDRAECGLLKPVQSGDEQGTDTEWIRKHTGLPGHCFHRETYRFHEAISPHAAAACEGVHIDLNAFQTPPFDSFDHLIIEGAGGLMAPLNRNHFMIDLIARLETPVLLVARSGWGPSTIPCCLWKSFGKEKLPCSG